MWEWALYLFLIILWLIFLVLALNAQDPGTIEILGTIVIVITVVIALFGIIEMLYDWINRDTSADRIIPIERKRTPRRDRAARTGLGPQMKYCTQCGKQININAQFCEFCGVEETP